MAEDGAHAAVTATTDAATATSHGYTTQSSAPMPPLTQEESPMSPRIHTPNPFSRHNTSLDLDDYFVSHGPWASGTRTLLTPETAERPTRYSTALEMAYIPENARQHPPEDDSSPPRCCCLGIGHHCDSLQADPP